jgi:hypothetical protein
MELSRLDRNRTILGAVASFLLVVSLLFLPWYSLDENTPTRVQDSGQYDPETFLCGEGDFDCTGFETFPILRWLLLLAALAPAILAWILIRGHKLSYPPGEMTMTAGFAAFILIGYNGVLDKPGSGPGEIGVSLDFGYWVALLCSVAIGAVGYLRSQASSKRERKAPGTV